MIQFTIFFQGEPFKWPTEYVEVVTENAIDAYNTLTQEQKDRVEFITSEDDVYSKYYLQNPEAFIIEDLPF